jgi:hypothetical protein
MLDDPPEALGRADEREPLVALGELHRTPGARGVGIAAEQVHEALLCEPQREIPIGGAGDELGGPLDQAAAVTQRKEAFLETLAGVALWVGDDRAQPPFGKTPHELLQTYPERARRGLQQKPSASPAERDEAQLLVAEAVGLGLGELTAGHDAHLHHALGQLPLQHIYARGDLIDRDAVVVVDVGSSANDVDAIPERLLGHCDAVLQIERPIVEAGQDVAVEIDHIETVRRAEPSGAWDAAAGDGAAAVPERVPGSPARSRSSLEPLQPTGHHRASTGQASRAWRAAIWALNRALPGENPTGTVYGTITVGALLAAESDLHDTYPETVGSVVVALLIYWLAHSYAELLGHRLATRERLTVGALGHALGRDWAIVRGAGGPLLALLIAWAAGATQEAAITVALWICAGSLVVFELLAGMRARARPAELALELCVGVAMGVGVIALRLILH